MKLCCAIIVAEVFIMEETIRVGLPTKNWFLVFHNDIVTMDQPRQLDEVLLFQMGDCCANPGYMIDSHEQVCHELVLICDGEAIMILNRQKFKVRRGQCLVLRHHTIHEIHCTGNEPMRMMYMGFMFTPGAERKYVDFISQQPFCIHEDIFGMRALFELALSEYNNMADLYDRALASLTRLLIISAYRSCQQASPPFRPQTNLKSIDNQKVRLLAGYIRENALKIDKLQDVADTFSYSYSHLSHIFSQQVGYTLCEFWERCRFQHAIDLMRDPDLTLTEIASLLNYQSIHTFSRAFRQHFGMTPSRCQRMMRSM